MRIHWAVVIFTVIGTILLTWHFRTIHMDFMKPHGVSIAPEENGTDRTVGPIALQPTIDNTPEVTEVLGNPEEPEIPVVAEITDTDLGDLEASPGLDSYRIFAKNNTPDRLFELSSTLRARGQFQRALLAFERIIDTTSADPAGLTEAAKGIETLAPTLPQWNVDPTTEISLILYLSTARTASDQLKEALLEVAILIRQSSSEQLEIIPKIKNSGNKDIPEDSPVALWLSTSDNEPVISPVITFKTTDVTDTAIDEVSLAVFRSIHSQLSKLGYPTPPSLEAPGKDLVRIYTTRLMWRDFARSLYLQKNAPATEDRSDTN